jgi:hypothetical protein
MAHWPDEEIDKPFYSVDRNFYKVEKWTKGGTKVARLTRRGRRLQRRS